MDVVMVNLLGLSLTNSKCTYVRVTGGRRDDSEEMGSKSISDDSTCSNVT